MPLKQLGLWPKGANNVRVEDDGVFQPSKRGAHLVEAKNVDLDAAGVPSQRSGTTDRLAGTDYRALTSCAGLLLAQDGGTIYNVTVADPFTKSALVTGLSATAEVLFHEYEGECYYTNGIVCGKITSAGVATHWGMTTPAAPTLGTTAGALPAGNYRVSVTLVDADGVESGAPEASVLADTVVTGSQAITVDVTSPDSNATHVKIYASEANQKELFFVSKVAVGSLPATVSAVGVSTEPLLTQHMRGPIPADAMFSHKGYMFLVADNVIFRSRGQTPHLYYPAEEVMIFPHTVKGGVGLDGGFFVATAAKLYWIAGKEPAAWKRTSMDTATYAIGGLSLPGERIPKLKTEDELALFVSEDGLVAGFTDGSIAHLTDDQLALDSAPTFSTMAYIERDELRQLFMLLTYNNNKYITTYSFITEAGDQLITEADDTLQVDSDG